MKPFNLEAAKAGAPVCTRDGHEAKIIYFNKLGDYPIVALIKLNDGDREQVFEYTIDGKTSILDSRSRYLDLLMEEEKHFDIKELKPYDKVLVRDVNDQPWSATVFSHITDNKKFIFMVSCNCFAQCIPYNEETKHLIGTTNMPPSKYTNW